MIYSLKATFYNIKALWNFYEGYRSEILIVFTLVSIQSLSGSLGLATFIPVFEVVENPNAAEKSRIAQYFVDFFEYIQLNPSLNVLIIFMAALFSFKFIFEGLALFLKSYITHKYIKEQQNTLFKATMQSRWQHRINQQTGRLMDDLNQQVHRAGELLGRVIKLLNQYTTVLVYTLICFFLSWEVTVFAIVSSVVMSTVLLPLVRKSKEFGNQRKEANQNFSDYVSQFFQGFKEIKAFNALPAIMDRIKRETGDLFKYKLMNRAMAIGTSIFHRSSAILLVVGYIYVSLKIFDLSMAEVGVVAILFWQIFQKATNISGFQVIANRMAALQKVSESLEKALEHREEVPENSIDPTFERDISLNNIHFWFDSDNISSEKSNAVLRDINLTIEKTDMIGLVGTSGGGKTTLLNLLLGFLKPTKGEIAIDQTPLRKLNIKKWRNMIGYVPQNSFLINDSIKTNISFFRDLEENQIQKSAHISQAHEFIKELPEGYETIVGEGGIKLSGGQKQRIALARALAQEPELLLLDEATSELDSHSEKAIQQSLEDLHGDITMVVVAHRLATVIEADKIIVLEDGNIIESGTSSQLLEEDGKFKSLYEQQIAL